MEYKSKEKLKKESQSENSIWNNLILWIDDSMSFTNANSAIQGVLQRYHIVYMIVSID